VWLQITGGELRCNEPPYNEDPGITEDIFQPSNISRTISRFHADLIVNHNTLYHTITTDTVTKKKIKDAYHNKLTVIWATSLWVWGRLRVVSNFGDGDCGAGKIHTHAREISRRRDAKGAPKIASRLLELSRARVCILPAPQSQSPKLETTRSLGMRSSGWFPLN